MVTVDGFAMAMLWNRGGPDVPLRLRFGSMILHGGSPGSLKLSYFVGLRALWREFLGV
jgi:hypothetical protein